MNNIWRRKITQQKENMRQGETREKKKREKEREKKRETDTDKNSQRIKKN